MNWCQLACVITQVFTLHLLTSPPSVSKKCSLPNAFEPIMITWTKLSSIFWGAFTGNISLFPNLNTQLTVPAISPGWLTEDTVLTYISIFFNLLPKIKKKKAFKLIKLLITHLNKVSNVDDNHLRIPCITKTIL